MWEAKKIMFNESSAVTAAYQGDALLWQREIPFTWAAIEGVELEGDSTIVSMSDEVYFNQWYSYDTIHWSAWTDYILLNSSHPIVYLAGNRTYSMNAHLQFSKKCKIVGGCVNGLVDCFNPDTTVINKSCGFVFYNCSNLVSIYENFLPATTLVGGYICMFDGCTSLTSIPEGLLPATTLVGGCYYYMFNGCTALTTVPEGLLPATTLAVSCYISMFRGCTSLVNAPALPASALTSRWSEMLCYGWMFQDCTSLVKAPDLPIEEFVDGSNYANMFSGCTSLNEIHTSAKTLGSYGQNATCNGWVDNVASAGDFYCYSTAGWTEGYDGIPYNWTVHYIDTPTPTLTGITLTAPTWKTDIAASGGTANSGNCNTDYTVTANYSDGTSADVTSSVTYLDGSSIVASSTDTSRHSCGNLTLTATYSGFTSSANVVMYQTGYVIVADAWVSFSAASQQYVTKPSDTTMYYSYDHTNWSSMTDSTTYEFGVLGKKTIYVIGKNTGGMGCLGFTFGNATSMFAVGGNAMALLDYENTGMTMSAQSFYNLFSGATALQSVSSNFLPATTLKYMCYYRMFGGCTSLTSIPENLLPATTLDQYCYGEMFNGCTSLTSIPEGLLPVTTLAQGCYDFMFSDCTSLTSIPEGLLPSTTLAKECYRCMFRSCTSLTSISENLLPATARTYGCYNSMFRGCTSLVKAPIINLDRLEDFCCQSMFSGCSSLNELHCNATYLTYTNTPIEDWLDGTAANGNFYGKSDIDWDYAQQQYKLPSTWTIHYVS